MWRGVFGKGTEIDLDFLETDGVDILVGKGRLDSGISCVCSEAVAALLMRLLQLWSTIMRPIVRSI